MGNVTSVPGEETQPVYLKDQTRFFVSLLEITTGSGQSLVNITPNAYPAERYVAKREPGNDAPVEYVQDPFIPASGAHPPSFLLQLPNGQDLVFKFTLVIRQTQPFAADPAAVALKPSDSTIQGLTFLFASTLQDVENLMTREFHVDPNIHKNPQVELLGDYSTSGSASVQTSWTWKWKPPRVSDSQPRGWRTSCCFVEYNHHAHRLDPLASFSVWVQDSQSVMGGLASPYPLSPLNPPLFHAKLRVPSSRSTRSTSDVLPSMADVFNSAMPENAADVAMPGPALASPNTAAAVPATSAETVRVDLPHHRAGEDFSNVDDGPIFRSAMKSMELKTSNMKTRWKKALKRAEETHEAHARFNEASVAMIESLKEISTASSNCIQPAVEHYFNTIAQRIMGYEHRTSTSLQKMVIEPISKYYNFEIKQADSKRKEFEEESREYYAYVSRYLGSRHEAQKEKKRAETDTKYQIKRRRFELKRFDYSSFIQDLHGGRKDQEVLSYLTKFAESQANDFLVTAKSIETMLPELKALIHEVKEADKDFKLQRSEREEKRRALETVSATLRDLDLSTRHHAGRDAATAEPSASGGHGAGQEPRRHHLGFPTRSASSAAAYQSSFPVAGPSTAPSTFEIPSQRSVENGLCHKEGILWSTSRGGAHLESKSLNMNKPAMHPYWVVLDQGMLAEYKKWQETFSSHPDQVVDIRVASARENQDGKVAESQLCFTVIAPNVSRTYQTTSHEEMKSWVAAINRAAQSALADNSTDRLADGPISKAGRTGKDVLGSPGGLVRRHATVGNRPAGTTTNGEALVKELQTANPANRLCADCCSTNGVAWAVINYGIVVCIKCSGVHRSLGSHISKVRSLTLDSAVFTPDVVGLLRAIGNKNCNAILEYRISEPSQKLAESATDEQRKRFILAKYSAHQFVMPLPSSFATADEFLLSAVRGASIKHVLHALALKANPNIVDKDRVHVFYLSLAAEDGAAMSAGLDTAVITTTTTIMAVPSNSPSNLGVQHSMAPVSPTPTPYSPGLASPLASPDPMSSLSGHPTSPPLGLGSSPPMPSSRLCVSRKLFPITELLLLNGVELPMEPCAVQLSQSGQDYLTTKRMREESTNTRYGSVAPSMSGPTHLKPADSDGGLVRSQKRASVAGKLSRISGR